MLLIVLTASAGPLTDLVAAEREHAEKGLVDTLAKTKPPAETPNPPTLDSLALLAIRWSLMEKDRCAVQLERIALGTHLRWSFKFQRTGKSGVTARAQELLEEWGAEHRLSADHMSVNNTHHLVSRIEQGEFWCNHQSQYLRAAEAIRASGVSLTTSHSTNDTLQAADWLEFRHLQQTVWGSPNELEATETRGMALLEANAESPRAKILATQLADALTEVRELYPYCGGHCSVGLRMMEDAEEDALDEPRCKAILADAPDAPIAVLAHKVYMKGTQGEAIYAIRASGCVPSTQYPGHFENLDEVKRHVGSCATVEGDDWVVWLRASRQAVIDGCAKLPEWATEN